MIRFLAILLSFIQTLKTHAFKTLQTKNFCEISLLLICFDVSSSLNFFQLQEEKNFLINYINTLNNNGINTNKIKVIPFAVNAFLDYNEVSSIKDAIDLINGFEWINDENTYIYSETKINLCLKNASKIAKENDGKKILLISTDGDIDPKYFEEMKGLLNTIKNEENFVVHAACKK